MDRHPGHEPERRKRSANASGQPKPVVMHVAGPLAPLDGIFRHAGNTPHKRYGVEKTNPRAIDDFLPIHPANLSPSRAAIK